MHRGSKDSATLNIFNKQNLRKMKTYTAAGVLTAYANGQRDFSNADLRGADLRNADLRGADLRDSNRSGTVFSGADLTGAKLFSVPNNIGYTISDYIDLTAEQSESDLSRAEFGLAYDLLYFCAETPKYDRFVEILTKKGVRQERAAKLAKMVHIPDELF